MNAGVRATLIGELLYGHEVRTGQMDLENEIYDFDIDSYTHRNVPIVVIYKIKTESGNISRFTHAELCAHLKNALSGKYPASLFFNSPREQGEWTKTMRTKHEKIKEAVRKLAIIAIIMAIILVCMKI